MKRVPLLLVLLFLASCDQIRTTKGQEQLTTQKDSINNRQSKASNHDYGINFHPKIEEYYTTDKSDCQIIDEPCFVLIYPTDEQIKALKALNESDFYVVADDNNYYMAEVVELSKLMNVKSMTAKKRKLCFLSKTGHHTVDLNRNDHGELMDWNLIIFNPNKTPEFYSFSEPNKAYLITYFNK